MFLSHILKTFLQENISLKNIFVDNLGIKNFKCSITFVLRGQKNKLGIIYFLVSLRIQIRHTFHEEKVESKLEYFNYVFSFEKKNFFNIFQSFYILFKFL